MNRRYSFTPERIVSLNEGEIFIFGSNLKGEHFGGAARLAYQQFGAEWGVSEGLTGQAYALPTVEANGRCVKLLDLGNSFMRLFETADSHPDNLFLLTKVGCGIAGYSVEEVSTEFWHNARKYYANRWTTNVGCLPDNLVIPEDFYTYMPVFYKANDRYNALNIELLKLERGIQRSREKASLPNISEERKELIHNLRVELESERNSILEDIQKLIAEETK